MNKPYEPQGMDCQPITEDEAYNQIVNNLKTEVTLKNHLILIVGILSSVLIMGILYSYFNCERVLRNGSNISGGSMQIFVETLTGNAFTIGCSDCVGPAQLLAWHSQHEASAAFTWNGWHCVGPAPLFA